MTNEKEWFTNSSKNALSYAQFKAELARLNYISEEHLLLGLLREENATAAKVLQELGVTVDDFELLVDELSRDLPRAIGSHAVLSTNVKRILELAVDEARRNWLDYIDTEHLLLGTIRLQSDTISKILNQWKLPPKHIIEHTRRAIKQRPKQLQSHPLKPLVPPICVSLSRNELEFGNWLSLQLKAHVIESWIDRVRIESDFDWDLIANLYLLQTTALVLILSPASVAAKHVAKERLFFSDILERPIIPVLWQDCEIDPALEKLGVIDLRGQREEGIAELVAAIRKVLPA